ncbi:phosphatase PAP2 family protein [Lacrimispora sp. 210928-DFI.3.58]|uniref:phosphatase PAP2 family protein n=1 Tax=Lacrimispora sp. 210928-DFI.3.58 TaxID=2883214 RepID=UPI0015B58B89|nr:phosphatase PAP2 family protein [Lacrimispora sp. 210928-DFI.3.58]MCB7318353.1 phosphoesterase [Lacrimispora sp. 210928-DFI.3.58]
MKQISSFLHKYRHMWLLSYGFIYLPWFCYLEKTVTRDYHIMHVSLDDLIPFNEYFIIPYLLWFLYVAGTLLFFLFTSREDYYRMCIFLFSGMTISLIICTFFRNGTDFRPAIDPDKNLFSALVATVYKTDTCTNVFPSIHVYNSIGTHIAIMRSGILKKYHWAHIGSGILMVSICLSTVFLKQHSVIDGVGAIILSYIIYGIVYGYNWSAQDKKVAQKALG